MQAAPWSVWVLLVPVYGQAARAGVWPSCTVVRLGARNGCSRDVCPESIVKSVVFFENFRFGYVEFLLAWCPRGALQNA